MKKIMKSLVVGCSFLFALQSTQAADKAATDKSVTFPAGDAKKVQRSDSPVLDATAFGFGTGTYGGNGILGGHLQIGVADWLRLHGGITGSLSGDQAGSFAMSNYWLQWQFSGGLMFTATQAYRGFLRPYTMLELTYYYDGKFKAGGLNGSLRVGVDIYMTQDYSIYVEAGIIAPFYRDVSAPVVSGGTLGVGGRTFF